MNATRPSAVTAATTTRQAWAAALALAVALRARLRYPSGSLTRQTPYGRLIATRVQAIPGVGYLELRATVRLPADEDTARQQTQQLRIGVDLTIRAVTGQPTLPTTPAATAAVLPTARRVHPLDHREPPEHIDLPIPARRAA